MGLNWTMRCCMLGFMLIYFNMYFTCVYIAIFIYMYTFIYFSGKVCLEGIVELLVEGLYVVFDFFTTPHSNSKHNNN